MEIKRGFIANESISFAKRERNRALRKKVATSSPRRPDGRDL
jgi:hypothetical protein